MYPCFPVDRHGFMQLFLPLMLSLVLSDLLFAQEPVKDSNAHKGNDIEYHLSIKGHRITLKPEEASLESILEATGQQMDIGVASRTP
jgi:hypothetical protein